MIQKLLGFDKQTMRIRTEVIAGITTFLTMSYILAVNPSILGTTGMDKGAVFTATALASAIATLLLAFMAKLPFAQAPSMALNAFFAFTLVQGMGYSWQTAMTAMFVEGVIFILITFLNIREIILNSIPMNLRYAISAGIGMFIAFIGLKNAGIIESNPVTYVMFGAFTPSSVLAMVGILLSGILIVKKVKGALFYSILICTLIGIPLGVTEIPEGFLPVSMPHSMEPTFCKFDFSEFFTLDMAVVIFTLLFMNIFDTVGTLVGLASKTGIMGEDGHIPHVKEAMMSDAIGTTIGAMMGSSTITTYVESASGIHFTDNRTAVYPGFVLCAVVPADSQCGHKRGTGACRCVYDGFDLQNRHGGYVGSAAGIYHHHYDGPHLLHCRRDGVGTALLCIGKTVLRQA